MKFSVALFGHKKHRYEVREVKPTRVVRSKGINMYGVEEFEDRMINRIVARLDDPPNYTLASKYFLYEVTGLEKRAIPGDIIAYKPYERRHTWTPTERTEFLIVTIDTQREILDGLFESYWDIDSYFPYNPLEFDDWCKECEELVKQARNVEFARKKWEAADKESEFEGYVKGMKKACMYPREHLKKRRMNYGLDVLKFAGVDIPRMLDRNILYDPQPEVEVETSNDKLKERQVVETDGLNLIPPVIH